MGLDVNRFMVEVEEDFLCVICKDVIEDPIPSHCDHIFCKKCINEWLKDNNTCPVDRKFATLSQLTQSSRFFRKHYSMLLMKCDFESNGCQTVCKIENLKTHQKHCEFNPNPKIKCKKGCDGLITKSEEQSHDCVQYLKSVLEKHVKELNDRKSVSSSNTPINTERMNELLQMMITNDSQSRDNETTRRRVDVMPRRLPGRRLRNVTQVRTCFNPYVQPQRDRLIIDNVEISDSDNNDDDLKIVGYVSQPKDSNFRRH